MFTLNSESNEARVRMISNHLYLADTHTKIDFLQHMYNSTLKQKKKKRQTTTCRQLAFLFLLCLDYFIFSHFCFVRTVLMVIYGTPIMQTFHFKYKLIRISLSLGISHVVCLLLLLLIIFRFFFLPFSQIKNDSKSNWTDYVMHDTAKNHPSSLCRRRQRYNAIDFLLGWFESNFFLPNSSCKRVFSAYLVFFYYKKFFIK